MPSHEGQQFEQVGRALTKTIGAVCAAFAFLAGFALVSPSVTTAAWEKETAWQRAEAAADRKDRLTAATLYHFAAIRGHADAQYKFAKLLSPIRNVGSDRADVLLWASRAERNFWFRQAAEQGHVRAQRKLGEIYERGYSTPQDYVTAYFWLSLAAEAKRGSSADRDRNELAQRMTRAQLAEAQARRVAWRLAFEARQDTNGQDVVLPGWDRAAEEAERLRMAAEQGDAAAQYALGARYAGGQRRADGYTGGGGVVSALCRSRLRARTARPSDTLRQRCYRQAW